MRGPGDSEIQKVLKDIMFQVLTNTDHTQLTYNNDLSYFQNAVMPQIYEHIQFKNMVV